MNYKNRIAPQHRSELERKANELSRFIEELCNPLTNYRKEVDHRQRNYYWAAANYLDSLDLPSNGEPLSEKLLEQIGQEVRSI